MRLYLPHDGRLVEVKDLRSQAVREVHRDDIVLITGAEYLRKSRLADQAEDERDAEARGDVPPSAWTQSAYGPPAGERFRRLLHSVRGFLGA